ncbi:hypothetical protein IG631_01710 [Alternaria alternata]|nr:hypothetical protein IG631_01710 [Alternaria alternata]
MQEVRSAKLKHFVPARSRACRLTRDTASPLSMLARVLQSIPARTAASDHSHMTRPHCTAMASQILSFPLKRSIRSLAATFYTQLNNCPQLIYPSSSSGQPTANTV